MSQPANSEEAMQLAFQVRNCSGHCMSGLLYFRNWSGKILQIKEKSLSFILIQGKTDTLEEIPAKIEIVTPPPLNAGRNISDPCDVNIFSRSSTTPTKGLVCK